MENKTVGLERIMGNNVPINIKTFDVSLRVLYVVPVSLANRDLYNSRKQSQIRIKFKGS